jgi:hypothetical protein
MKRWPMTGLGQSRHLNGALGVSAIAPIATKMV